MWPLFSLLLGGPDQGTPPSSRPESGALEEEAEEIDLVEERRDVGAEGGGAVGQLVDPIDDAPEIGNPEGRLQWQSRLYRSRAGVVRGRCSEVQVTGVSGWCSQVRVHAHVQWW